MLLIRLTIVIFYHLFGTNNSIGNYCMGKDFFVPRPLLPHVFRFALASRSLAIGEPFANRRKIGKYRAVNSLNYSISFYILYVRLGITTWHNSICL